MVTAHLTRRRRVTDICLAVARAGIAHEFFGHLYEAVGKIPHRFAGDPQADAVDRKLPSLRSPGSPLRYFAPVEPVTVAATLTALVTARGQRGQRWIAVTATSLLLCNGLCRSRAQRSSVRGWPSAHSW
ncbi:MAG: hypothetical protein JOZ47_19075 [Kutzneria sp.]|nr:hypothetical protein [Kutzneria sp.]MBV9847148.1 hypothetical protein [Kutzneria sp.]